MTVILVAVALPFIAWALLVLVAGVIELPRRIRRWRIRRRTDEDLSAWWAEVVRREREGQKP